jgi:hypothetical protein
MKGWFWISGGFGDSTKRCALHEAVTEFKLDFVVLSEKGISNFAAPFLNHMFVGLDYGWYFHPPHGHSSGILIGINMDTLDSKKLSQQIFLLSFMLYQKRWLFVGTSWGLWVCTRCP